MDGLDSFLDETLAAETTDRDALVLAARIDAAYREVFRAPRIEPFRPSADDAARLLDAHLEPSPASALIEERWPLVELRHVIVRAASADEAPIPIPPELARPRAWSLVREAEGIRHVALEAREAELLGLLQKHTVRDALARLEEACTESERAELPARTQRWLARSVERGSWIGMR
jgi:hypothetical protein